MADSPLFVDDEDREKYLELLGGVVGICGWRCMGYCLMSNHVHLLIETPEPNLGAGIQRLHGGFAAYFNRRHAGRGHRFAGRYGNRRVSSDEQFYAVVRYIALNPVEAGLCIEPEHWRWSSHRDVLHDTSAGWFDRDALMRFFAARGGHALDRYRRFVAGEVTRTRRRAA